MNDELLQLVYGKFKTDATFEEFKSDIQNNKDLQQLAYSKVKTEASFDDFVKDLLPTDPDPKGVKPEVDGGLSSISGEKVSSSGDAVQALLDKYSKIQKDENEDIKKALLEKESKKTIAVGDRVERVKEEEFSEDQETISKKSSALIQGKILGAKARRDFNKINKKERDRLGDLAKQKLEEEYSEAYEDSDIKPTISQTEIARKALELKKEEEDQKRYEGTSTMGQARMKFAEGVLNIVSGVAGVQNFVNKTLASFILPDQVLDEINTLAPEGREQLLNKLIQEKSPLGILKQGQVSVETRDKIQKLSSVVGEGIVRYELSINQDIANGNYLKAFNRLVTEGVGTAPTIMTAMLPGGVAILGTTAAVDKFDQLEEEGYGLGASTAVNSILTGVAEGVFETVTARLGGKMLKSFQNADIIQKRAILERGLMFLKETQEEGLSEVATGVSQTIIDALVSGKEIDLNEAFDEWMDAYLIGAFSGGGMSVLGGAAQEGHSIIEDIKTQKILKDSKFNSLSEVFIPIANKRLSKNAIALAAMSSNNRRLERQLEKAVAKGEMTEQESQDIKKNFLETQAAFNKTKGVKLTADNRAKITGYIKRKTQLEAEVKGMDPIVADAKKKEIEVLNTLIQKTLNDKSNTTDKPIQETEKKSEEVSGKETKEATQVNREVVVKNTAEEVNRITSLKEDVEDGATLNQDGTKFEGSGLVVPVASKNLKQSELTPEAIADFVEEQKESIGADNVKVGLYKFPNSDQVSIDLNIVVDPKYREQALAFGKEAGQESLFDLSTFENVKTGADGKNPMSFTPAQFKIISKSLSEGKFVDLLNLSATKDTVEEKEIIQEGSSKTVEDALKEIRKKDSGVVVDRKKLDTQVENAKKATSSIAPNLEIEVFESSKELQEAFPNEDLSDANAFYDPETGKIYVDASRATDTTVAHEVLHAILKTEIDAEPEIQKVTLNMIKALQKTLDKDTAKTLNDFMSRYDGKVQSEEAIAELVGLLANNYTQLSSESKGIIKQWLDKLAKMLGLKPFTDAEVIGFLNTVAGKVASGEVITNNDISAITEGASTYVAGPSTIKKQVSKGEKVKVGKHELSFVKEKDLIDIDSLVQDISDKGQKVWFWVADQLGRGHYKDMQISKEHYLDAGPSYALDPKNRSKNIIWATGKKEAEINKLINKSDYIFIISGSPIKSKLFNKRVFDLFTERVGKYETFKKGVFENSPTKAFRTYLEKYNSWESMAKSPDRKKLLNAVEEVKLKKSTPLKSYLQDRGGFIDMNDLRDGFYKDNNFSMNDVMLVLKPESFGGTSSHSTYENDIIGEVVGVPDKKINAYDLMPDEVKSKYKKTMTETQKTQVVAPYGIGVKSIKKQRSALPKRSDLKKDLLVTIEPRRERGKTVVGKIKEILTNSDSHPYGILVSLVDGTIGRVKEVLAGEAKRDPNKIYEGDILFTMQGPERVIEVLAEEGADMYVLTSTGRVFRKERGYFSLREEMTPEGLKAEKLIQDLNSLKTIEDNVIFYGSGYQSLENVRGVGRVTLADYFDLDTPEKIDKVTEHVKNFSKDTKDIISKSLDYGGIVRIGESRMEITFGRPGDVYKDVYGYWYRDGIWESEKQTGNGYRDAYDIKPASVLSGIKKSAETWQTYGPYIELQELEKKVKTRDSKSKRLIKPISEQEQRKYAAMAPSIPPAVSKVIDKKGSVLDLSRVFPQDSLFYDLIKGLARSEKINKDLPLQWQTAKEDRRTGGYYQAKGHYIAISRWTNPSVIAHEMVHGVTAASLDLEGFSPPYVVRGQDYIDSLNNFLKDDKRSPEVKRLVELYLETLEKSGLMEEAKQFANSPDHWIGGHYGLTNIDEFMAEAFSTKKFQVFLNSIQVDSKSTIFTKFVGIIKDLLNKIGVKVQEGSMLEEAIKATEGVMQLQERNFERRLSDMTLEAKIQAAKDMIKARGVKKQTSDFLQRSVDLLKQNGYSNSVIIEAMQVEGYKEADIVNAINNASENPLKSFKEDYERSEAMAEEERADNRSAIKKVLDKLVDQILDRQGSVKSMVDDSGLDGVTDYMVTSAGASSYAKERSEKAWKATYDGLSKEETDLLNMVVSLKRIIAIDNHTEVNGLEPVIHYNGRNKKSAEKILEELREEHGSEVMNKIEKRAESYFNEYRKILEELFVEGLVSETFYERYKDVDYSPTRYIEMLQELDGIVSDERVGEQSNFGLSQEQIQALKREKDPVQRAIKEKNFLHEYMGKFEMLQRSLLTRTKAIFNNRLNSHFATTFKNTLKEYNEGKLKGKQKKEFERLMKHVKDDQVIFDENGVPKGYAKSKAKGWKSLYYYQNGVRHRLLTSQEFYNKFTDTNNRLGADLTEKAKLATGTALVKTIATGNNPTFFLTNTPRDFWFALNFSEAYGKTTKVLGMDVTILPWEMLRLTKDMVKGVKQVVKGGDLYQKALEYGLGMDFLAIQGRYKRGGVLSRFIDRNVPDWLQTFAKYNKGTQAVQALFKGLGKFNLASEVGIRMAIFERMVRKQMKEQGIKDLEAASVPKEVRDRIYTKAVRAAREITDFNQGGRASKAIDAAIPYFNAAVQGTRAAVKAGKERPVDTTFRILQTVTMGATAGLYLAVNLMSAFRDDEDEEIKNMTNEEIYFATLKDVSEYDLRNYFILPLGTKDERGNWKFIRVAKAQALTPALNVVESIRRNQMAQEFGINYSENLSNSLYDAFVHNVIPEVSPLSPPIVASAVALSLGMDTYTGNPLDWKSGEIPKQLEGIVSDRVDPFYKQLGESFNMSPVRLQKGMESFITNPNVNIYVGLAYGVLNSSIGGGMTGKERGNILQSMGKGAMQRLVKSGSEYNNVAKIERSLSNQELEIWRDHIQLEDKVKRMVRDYKVGKTTQKELTEGFEKIKSEIDPTMAISLKSWVRSEMKKQQLSPMVSSVKFIKNKKVKAVRLAKYFGDALMRPIKELPERDQALIKELFKAKALDKETIMHYKEMFK